MDAEKAFEIGADIGLCLAAVKKLRAKKFSSSHFRIPPSRRECAAKARIAEAAHARFEKIHAHLELVDREG